MVDLVETEAYKQLQPLAQTAHDKTWMCEVVPSCGGDNKNNKLGNLRARASEAMKNVVAKLGKDRIQSRDSVHQEIMEETIVPGEVREFEDKGNGIHTTVKFVGYVDKDNEPVEVGESNRVYTEISQSLSPNGTLSRELTDISTQTPQADPELYKLAQGAWGMLMGYSTDLSEESIKNIKIPNNKIPIEQARQAKIDETTGRVVLADKSKSKGKFAIVTYKRESIKVELVWIPPPHNRYSIIVSDNSKKS